MKSRPSYRNFLRSFVQILRVFRKVLGVFESYEIPRGKIISYTNAISLGKKKGMEKYRILWKCLQLPAVLFHHYVFAALVSPISYYRPGPRLRSMWGASGRIGL